MKYPSLSHRSFLYMRVFLALLLLSGASFSAPTIDLEIDPADLALGGYRIHAGYVRLPFRYDVGVLHVAIPEALHGNENFNYAISGFSGRVDYLFDSYQRWFVGLEGTLMKNDYTHKRTKITETRHPFLLAMRMGYRFEFFEHLTITPWVGMGVLLNKGADQVKVDGDRFDVPTLNVFPTVHLGWVF